jgi:hypothetical protein
MNSTTGQRSNTCRDETGVIVTVIADNYFGYCRKEVDANQLRRKSLRLCEEEHAGGALVFPAFDLGENSAAAFVKQLGHSLG